MSVTLTQDRHQLIVCEGDADTQTAGEVLDLPFNKENVTVFAEETDINTLLRNFWNSKMAEIFMTPEAKKLCGKSWKMFLQLLSKICCLYTHGTNDTAKYHNLRVCLQILYWKTLLEKEFDPALWGCHVFDWSLEPIITKVVG